jgi:hypothetical protein
VTDAPHHEMSQITKNEFVTRFRDRMVATVGGTFSDGASVEEYALSVAETYWEDAGQRADGPEECADADLFYGAEDDA